MKFKATPDKKCTGFFISCVFLFLLFFVGNLSAQQVQLKGWITDENGVGIPGVTVKEKTSGFAVLSGSDGFFTFLTKERKLILTFQKNGFIMQERAVTQGTSAMIVLQKEIDIWKKQKERKMDLGFLTLREKNLSTAVSSYEFNEFPFTGTEISQWMDMVPGISTFGETGDPSGNFGIQIRGSESVYHNQPLVILDGIMMNSGIGYPGNSSAADPLSFIRPGDIKKISVLKSSAASAIYGSQGGNGAVIIETKKGNEEGMGLGFFGQTGIRVPVHRDNLMGTKSYVRMMDESLLNSGMNPSGLESGAESDPALYSITRLSPENRYALVLSAGNELNSVYTSTSFRNAGGVTETTGYTGAGFNLGGHASLAKWLDFSVRLGFGRYWQNTPFSPDLQFKGNPYSRIMQHPPVSAAVLTSDPLFSGGLYDNDPAGNFQDYLLKENGDQSAAGIGIQAKLSKSLGLQVFMSGNNTGFSSRYKKPLIQEKTGSLYNWQIRYLLKYQKNTPYNQFSVLAGYVSDYNKVKQDVVLQMPESSALPYIFTGRNSRRSNSIFLQAGAAFYERWDVMASLRREQILRLNGTDQFGIFPAVSSGVWLLKNLFSDEKGTFSGIKFTVSWGISGSDAFVIPVYANEGNSAGTGFPDFPEYITAAGVRPDSRWEYTEEWNYGMKSFLFEETLRMSFNYFDRYRSDVAFMAPVQEGEVNRQWLYSGHIRNAGWEWETEYENTFGPLNIRINAGIEHSKSTLLDFGADYSGNSISLFSAPFTGNVPLTVLQKGETPGVFTGYVFDGIFQSQEEVDEANLLNGQAGVFYQDKATGPGDIRFKDLDNNGIIDERDIAVIGNPEPGLLITFGWQLVYGRFDCSAGFLGSTGSEIYHLDKTWSYASGGTGNRHNDLTYSWNPVYPSSQIPRLHFFDPNRNNRPHSGMVEKANYFALRTFDIGYTFGTEAKDNPLRVFISAGNVILGSSYSGNYPVAGSQNGFINTKGLDFGRYPHSTTLMLGIQWKM